MDGNEFLGADISGHGVAEPPAGLPGDGPDDTCAGSGVWLSEEVARHIGTNDDRGLNNTTRLNGDWMLFE